VIKITQSRSSDDINSDLFHKSAHQNLDLLVSENVDANKNGKMPLVDLLDMANWAVEFAKPFNKRLKLLEVLNSSEMVENMYQFLSEFVNDLVLNTKDTMHGNSPNSMGSAIGYALGIIDIYDAHTTTPVLRFNENKLKQSLKNLVENDNPILNAITYSVTLLYIDAVASATGELMGTSYRTAPISDSFLKEDLSINFGNIKLDEEVKGPVTNITVSVGETLEPKDAYRLMFPTSQDCDVYSLDKSMIEVKIAKQVLLNYINS